MQTSGTYRNDMCDWVPKSFDFPCRKGVCEGFVTERGPVGCVVVRKILSWGRGVAGSVCVDPRGGRLCVYVFDLTTLSKWSTSCVGDDIYN